MIEKLEPAKDKLLDCKEYVQSWWAKNGMITALTVIAVGTLFLLVLGVFQNIESKAKTDQIASQTEQLERQAKEIAEQNERLESQATNIERQLEILESQEENRDKAVETIINYLECMLTAMGEEGFAEETKEECRQRIATRTNSGSTQQQPSAQSESTTTQENEPSTPENEHPSEGTPPGHGGTPPGQSSLVDFLPDLYWRVLG